MRARASISLTTTGNSGVSTYNSSTGDLNVPSYTLAGLGGVGLSSLSANSPLTYNSGTGAFSIQVSNTSQSGYLSNIDWNTFSGKQNTVVLTTTGTSGVATFNASTGALNIPDYSQYTPTDNTATRTINSSTYTISASKPATVKYVVKITCTATIGSNSSGKVVFQYSTNGGSSWIDGGEVENSNSVSLAIVLNSTTIQSSTIVWSVPANALCRLVPTSSGTTTITWVRGQETY